jgi:hypothetical protein
MDDQSKPINGKIPKPGQVVLVISSDQSAMHALCNQLGRACLDAIDSHSPEIPGPIDIQALNRELVNYCPTRPPKAFKK